MKLIIWAVIFALALVILTLAGNFFAIEIPSWIISTTNTLFVVCVIIPYAVKEDKRRKAEKKDKE